MKYTAAELKLAQEREAELARRRQIADAAQTARLVAIQAQVDERAQPALPGMESTEASRRQSLAYLLAEAAANVDAARRMHDRRAVDYWTAERRRLWCRLQGSPADLFQAQEENRP